MKNIIVCINFYVNVRNTVWYAVLDNVRNNVRNTVWNSVLYTIWMTVENAVWMTVRTNVRNTVLDNVKDKQVPISIQFSALTSLRSSHNQPHA